MVLSSDIIESIAQDLSNSKEALRAKKLVFYVSQRYWETDTNVINDYSFFDLLENLHQTNPTLEDLKALLHHAVETLNRKTIYKKIATYVLRRMSDLYQIIPVEEDYIEENETSDTEIVEAITEAIQNHEESARMKKVIFAVCKQYWEADINVIDMYDMRDLIREIKELYPSSKRLKKALDMVVSSINRQNFYTFIADTIMDNFNHLYPYEVRDIDKDTNSGDEETQLIKAQSKKPTQETEKSQTSTPSQPQEISQPTEEVKRDVTPSSVPEGQIIPWLKIENLFELKQEIMQYTNPLRAKILLFYAVYDIDTLEQHWSIVRTCSFDDLLIRMFEHYDKNIEVIAKKLQYVANSPIEGLEQDENLQAVTAIIESIKRFYRKK
ncbi:hypothetical protein A5482_004890 [Cyanobacterium sp. IPPAS B-1200]|uniref:hypothetical protein n=1 Tax=Cyanobacterium sp. IPPAS B-1200 TaxID=1562720 RepID=UPI0008525C43|nr:hypothetical protein [Cyanobacterium sp. IPPAS B-1200]OEJ78643.1 hypothetical protein A5482_01830 [Cyanobacterium sp. IPPAS B-1200]